MMYVVGEQKFNVITKNGVTPIKDIKPGDIVYEYKTSNQLVVQGVKQSKISNRRYRVNYNDGRTSIHIPTDLIYDGKRIIPIEFAYEHQKIFNVIKQYPVDFNNLMDPLDPDPYIAGAIITYGDTVLSQKDIVINSDLNCSKFIDCMKSMNYYPYYVNNKYIHLNFKSNGHVLKWKELFEKYDHYKKKVVATTTPLEYTRASINDRQKYIRGVFDMGYISDIFPDTVGIVHKYSSTLETIQKILWSLGVLSVSRYDSINTNKLNMNFYLEIIGSYTKYPGFFYGIDNIEYFLDKDNNVMDRIPQIELRIVSIDCIENDIVGYNLVLDKPNQLYLDGDFLPRVAL